VVAADPRRRIDSVWRIRTEEIGRARIRPNRGSRGAGNDSVSALDPPSPHHRAFEGLLLHPRNGGARLVEAMPTMSPCAVRADTRADYLVVSVDPVSLSLSDLKHRGGSSEGYADGHHRRHRDGWRKGSRHDTGF